MLFNSFEFLIFFPLVTLIYFLVPARFRWIHLLIASCIFYCAFIPIYIFILFFLIIVDYIAGILIENAEGRKRFWYPVISIVANVGVLAFFKYFNFFNDNVNAVLHGLHLTYRSLPLLNIILPIGLSFHTFQAMSYTIEVYRGNFKAEKHFGFYALYVMFYPQLVAGPIERPQNLLPQLRGEHYFDYDNVTNGLKQMCWGMFKKVVIADRLAMVTYPVFEHAGNYPSLTLCIAAIFHCYQVYCDFSGYADIAIGAARIMGIKLMKNFDRPFSSTNIAEFWRRWHISLTSWFRDYVYIPAGGSRGTMLHRFFNLMLVFVLCGFWHGATWTYIVYGAIQGFFIIFAVTTQSLRDKISSAIGISKVKWLDEGSQVIITFSLIATSGVFFGTYAVHEATYFLYKMLQFPIDLIQLFTTQHFDLKLSHDISMLDLWLAFALLVFMEVLQYLHSKINVLAYLNAKPFYLRWATYFAAIILIYVFGVFENRQFVYFQF